MQDNNFWVGLGLWCLTPLYNNISAISWWSVFLVEETRVPGENHSSVVIITHTKFPKISKAIVIV
jgi:hypothetical protein